MKKIILFHLADCPYCHNAKRALEELERENPAYKKIPIEWIEEQERPPKRMLRFETVKFVYQLPTKKHILCIPFNVVGTYHNTPNPF